jgi:hypothetical protein
MTSAEFNTANRNCRALFVLITFLSLVVLGGCGGGWQPDRAVRQDQRRPGIEGSELNGPLMEDSRTHL